MTICLPNLFYDSLIKKYGAENGEIAYFLLQEQSRLINNWRTFLFLFCGDKRRIDIMQQASAPFFFGAVQGALWDVTILRLRRLTDPNETRGGRDQNIGLQRLKDLVPDAQRLQQADLVDAAVDACASVKNDVNKALAHNDLPTLMAGTRFQTIRMDVTAAVKSVKLAISNFYYDGDLALAEQQFPITPTDDEQAMLAKLFVGNLKMDEVRREEFDHDIANGPQANPYKIIPDWLWDHDLRDDPF